ncbi:MAG: hypothetical protein H7835_20880, partial [Magnetococcus sp. XQGC-1]
LALFNIGYLLYRKLLKKHAYSFSKNYQSLRSARLVTQYWGAPAASLHLRRYWGGYRRPAALTSESLSMSRVSTPWEVAARLATAA